MNRFLKFALYLVGLLLVLPSVLHLVPFKDWGYQGFDGPFAWHRFGWTYISDFAVNFLVGVLCILAAIKYDQINIYVPNSKPVLSQVIFVSGVLLAVLSIGLIWAIIYDIKFTGIIPKDLLLATFGIFSAAFTKLGIGLLAMFIAKKIGVKHD